jgi:mannan endo-1,4-beta-mannosidase
MFWQYGNTLSTGQTVDDGYPIFYGTSGYTSLVTNHVAAIG